MTEFKMPTDISEKEKIVGGLITAGQLLYIGIGLCIIVGLGPGLNGIFGNASFIIGALIGLPFGICFAFVKPHKIPLMSFIKMKLAHKRHEHHLINHDPDIDEIEFNYFEIERL